ncbi:uncharacterized protein P884DRAFT_262931 [Thermothelomyces heterothallicus CBS 202.75]|uniref:uncharacterized protein n=1 Tax=Thermothelomyces heterothallicus CBS 202.75 TaxID=1149848 RepID=UPI003743E258
MQEWTGGTSCGPAALLQLLLSLLPGKQPSPPPAEPSSVTMAPRQRQPASAITKTGSTQRREPLFSLHRPEERDTGMWEAGSEGGQRQPTVEADRAEPLL